MRSTLRVLAGVGLALLLAAPAPCAPAVIKLTLPSGRALQSEVMIDDADRQMGLMYRPSLAEDHGMLFVFADVDFHGIWMKNCKFAIDIVWLDENHKVVHVAEAVPPCARDPCPVYAPMQKAAFVIEMSAKLARREKVVVGSQVQFELPAK